MKKKIIIDSDIKSLRIVEAAIDEISSDIGINKDNYGKILVSTMEAVNNAIVHGNNSEKSKKVEINISCRKNLLEISIADEGEGFKAEQIPDPTKAENIENTSGRGVFLMSRLADKLKFNERGNKVTMFFKL
jgi:serine/threonine-protein kinase RsbW